jgi:hypothetical protein
MPVQWVHLAPDRVLVASNRGAWLQRPELGARGIVGPMPESIAATVATTRQLLDGAITLAERDRPAPAGDEQQLTARRWAWDLVGQWHCAHHSVALLPEVIARYEGDGRSDLASFARAKLDEEQGHDQFPLDDLRALGYEAEAVVREVAPAPVTTAALEYARGCVFGSEPVEFLGYVYALERCVLSVPRELFAALEAVLPAGVEAASGLRLHVDEFDSGHVEDALSFISGLPAVDRTAIAVGCHRTTQILCEPFDQPSDAELESWFAPYERAELSSERA